MYIDDIYSLQILLSRTQAGPGRTFKQEQEQTSPNHVQRINLISVCPRVVLGLPAASGHWGRLKQPRDRHLYKPCTSKLFLQQVKCQQPLKFSEHAVMLWTQVWMIHKFHFFAHRLFRDVKLLSRLLPAIQSPIEMCAKRR